MPFPIGKRRFCLGRSRTIRDVVCFVNPLGSVFTEFLPVKLLLLCTFFSKEKCHPQVRGGKISGLDLARKSRWPFLKLFLSTPMARPFQAITFLAVSSVFAYFQTTQFPFRSPYSPERTLTAACGEGLSVLTPFTVGQSQQLELTAPARVAKPLENRIAAGATRLANL